MGVTFLSNMFIRKGVAMGLSWTWAAHYAKIFDPGYIGAAFADAYAYQSRRHAATQALAPLSGDSYITPEATAVVPFRVDMRYHLYGQVHIVNPTTMEETIYPQHAYTNRSLTRQGYEDILAEAYRRGDPGSPKCGYLNPGVVWKFELVTIEENEGWGE